MAEAATWDYCVFTVGGVIREVKDDEFEALLNSLGEQGWEIISVTPLQNTNRLKVVGKRPLSATVRRHRTRPESFT